jgi:hypothetical protein
MQLLVVCMSSKRQHVINNSRYVYNTWRRSLISLVINLNNLEVKLEHQSNNLPPLVRLTVVIANQIRALLRRKVSIKLMMNISISLLRVEPGGERPLVQHNTIRWESMFKLDLPEFQSCLLLVQFSVWCESARSSNVLRASQ